MITFILIFAGLVVVAAAWFVASGAKQRKRENKPEGAQVQAQQEGSGAPAVGRATGSN